MAIIKLKAGETVIVAAVDPVAAVDRIQSIRDGAAGRLRRPRSIRGMGSTLVWAICDRRTRLLRAVPSGRLIPVTALTKRQAGAVQTTRCQCRRPRSIQTGALTKFSATCGPTTVCRCRQTRSRKAQSGKSRRHGHRHPAGSSLPSRPAST